MNEPRDSLGNHRGWFIRVLHFSFAEHQQVAAGRLMDVDPRARGAAERPGGLHFAGAEQLGAAAAPGAVWSSP